MIVAVGRSEFSTSSIYFILYFSILFLDFFSTELCVVMADLNVWEYKVLKEKFWEVKKSNISVQGYYEKDLHGCM